jgi:hypothetical protein
MQTVGSGVCNGNYSSRKRRHRRHQVAYMLMSIHKNGPATKYKPIETRILRHDCRYHAILPLPRRRFLSAAPGAQIF